MPKLLYDSPDIPVIDYKDTSKDSNAQRPFAIDDRTLAKKAEMKNDAKEVLEGLTGYVRVHDFRRGEDMGEEGTTTEDILAYLQNNIPDTSIYLSGLPEDATDEDKIEAIRVGLEGRSKVIDEYNNRVIECPPFIGRESEEACGRQEGPVVSQRYKSQYERIPAVRSVSSSRSSVKSYKVQHNPKPTGMKFL